MSTQEPQEPQFSEEELRAIEAEMEKVTVDDVLLQTIVSLLNLGARKAGLGGPSGEAPREPDLEQVRQAVEGARALMPLVEPRHGEQLGPIRDALSRLQMFYAQRSGDQAAPTGEPAQPQADSGAGSAQSSGRLWVPGQ
ncbi:MAG: hypothetical protein QOJ21_3799 [Solirubrobacteraceae bacterium]|nr:hypothetical protein [Solirubrobacteraceae bacterium]